MTQVAPTAPSAVQTSDPTPAPPPAPVPGSPQSGIRNRPPEHAIVAAITLPADQASTVSALATLRQIQAEELSSQLPVENAQTPKAQPSPETGEIGFADGFDRGHLTITTGFSSTAYDKLGVAAANRPQDLIPIPWAQLGDQPAQANYGDIVVQICSDDPYVCEHALHRVLYGLSGQATLVWAQVGVQRYTSREGRINRAEGRALTGFIDGTSNLDPRRCDHADDTLIFVDPDAVPGYPHVPATPQPVYGQPAPPSLPGDLRQPPASEPPWTKFGSYMVVRSTLVDFDKWDPANLGAQEQTIGRYKYSGAFLDLADDPANLKLPPAFAANQTAPGVPITAHTRKANPRGGAEDAQRRLFRRGYPLIVGSTNGIDRGLLFIAFARTISTQFEFIFRAWMRNPNFPTNNAGPDALFSFEKQVLCGGYYFVPPLTDPCDPTSWIVPTT